MATFRFRGTDGHGARAEGEVDAATLEAASEEVRRNGVLSLSLQRVDAAETAPRPADIDAFSFFNRSLADMTRLGIPLPRAIAEIARGLRGGRFKRDLESVESALREGRSFAQAVSSAASFPPHYRAMLRAGEASGNLAGVLLAVARNSEGLVRVKRALINALTYPLLVLGFGAALSAGFLVYVLPLYERLYRTFGMAPEGVMRLVLGFFSTAAWPVAAAGLLVTAALSTLVWMNRSPSGEAALYRLPLLGRVLHRIMLARFFGSLGVLLRARAPLPDALPVALAASGSVGLSAEAEYMRAKLAEGRTLGDVLAHAPLVPTEIAGYVALGDKLGRLGDSCSELTDLLTEQAASATETLFLVLFPTALAATGVLLGSACVTLLQPHFQFLERVGR
jgi:type IV pilus assembly protein PilC